MRRLDAPSAALLATLLPIWLVAFGLHVTQVFETGLAQPGFFVALSDGSDDYPRVRGFRLELAGGADGLQVGDRVLRIGEVDLRGIGHVETDAIAIREAGDGGWFPVVLERDGRELAVRGELVRARVPWARIPTLLGAVLVGVAVLLRAPRSAKPRLVFVVFVLFSLQQTPFHGGSVAQTVASKVIFYALGPIAPALMLLWVVGFPPEAPRPGRLARALPWTFGVVYAFLRANYFLAGPLPPGFAPVAVQVADGLFVATILCVLTRNYWRSDPVGRRRVKWMLYGCYVGFLPWAITTGFLSTLGGSWYSDALYFASIPTVAMPIGIFVAILSQQLFDIDRLISATASYTAVIVLAVVGALTLIPTVASAAGVTLGVDPSLLQGILTLALAAVVIPVQRRLRPAIERVFFPELHSLEIGMPGLIGELADSEDPADLASRVGEGLDRLLRPESCVVYTRTPTSFAPVFVAGRHPASELDIHSALVAVLALHKEPVAGEPTAGGRARHPLAPFDRAVLLELGVALVAPVHAKDQLAAFVALGPKRSGDIYTAAEVAWIGAIVGLMAAELQHFDSTRLIERSRELQDAYRRYVPGPVAEQIDRGGSLDVGEREVTVLFVDIRSYTSFSETREAKEIFSTVNRYTQTVSRLVRDNGGTVVEFNGDGMMVVFGAPRELDQKERAAVMAAEEILLELQRPADPESPPLVVGIGIATGSAFIGNIQAADRRIWTAIGNTTNLAARLQSLTRDLGVVAVIDETTWRRAGPLASRFVRRPETRIRGLRESQDVYAKPQA